MKVKIQVPNHKTSKKAYASLYFSYADRYKSIDEIIANNPDVFNSKAGCFPGKFTLDINQKLKPVAIPSRRVPQKIREKYKQFLHDLCVQKIIANTSNPVGWISPVVLLEKANGSLRLCLDPKYLNEALGRPFYQIPSHEEINASLSNKRLCTVMDFSSGFWHCKLDSKSSNLCQFSTPFGVYKFLRLPFGLKPSPEIFQKAACDIFGEIDGVLIYFDDILIAANSEEEHDAIFQKYIADALSRDYLPHTSSDEVKMLQVHMVTCKKYRDSIYLEATNNDKILQEVIGYVKTEWPIKIKISPEAQQYWWCRNFLAFENSLLFFKDRLVIPHELRTRALQELHVGHQGIVKCKTLASQTIYWPGITKDVEKFVSECCVCARSAPSLRKQPLMPHPIPDLPYQNIAVDILDFNGKYFLVTVDCYSKWLDVNSLSSTKSSSVNNVLEHLFSVHGIPEVIYSDNVPFNSKEFQQFLQMYNCQNLTCSPHHHQSNGLAEKYVDVARKFLEKCSVDKNSNLSKATPLPSIGLSPAQMLMSRNLRSFVPIKANLLKPFVNPNIKDKLKAKQDTMTELYNKKAKRKSHEFQVGDLVYAQNVVTMYWEPAIILEICDKPRSCVVKIGRSEVRRNSRHIKPRLMSEPVITVPNTLPYVIANQLVSNSVNVPNPDPIVETQPRRSTREKKSVERLNL
ncbi:hypothetical protein FOCC_FOCC010990 [Frankliniella occidentalis]|nr:hypothetical protein FOCC_FOCC010990 [Frankliniella occidentalis]